MRLIDVDELKKCAIPCEIHQGSLTELCVPLYQIDNAPTVETDIEVIAQDAYKQGYTDGWKERFGEPNERPQGEWVDQDFDDLKISDYRCNQCGHYQDDISNFCPECGADMRGKEE